MDFHEEMKKLLEEQGTAIHEFKNRHLAEVDSLKKKINALEAKSNRPGAPMSTMDCDWTEAGRKAGWVNEKGEPVRVLAPNELLGREAKSETGSLGDTVRALVTGARNEFEAKALGEGVQSAGGFTVPAPLATWFIDRLRSQSVTIRAGARTVPMDSQSLAIVRLESDPAIGWRAEHGDIAEGDPSFGRIVLNAKSLAGIVRISRELLDDTVNAGAMIESAFLKVMALELDRAAIYGDGTNNTPIGVIHTAGINEVATAANGAVLSNYDKLIDAIYEMHLDNAGDPTAAIMHPRTGASLAKLKDATGNPLTMPEMVSRVPRLVTTAAPISETQGTSNDCSSVVFGDFSQLFIGLREDVNIRVLSEAFAGTGEIGILIHARADVALAHKESFCRLRGVRA